MLFALSGATALVYEVVWFRLVFLRLGGTGLSVATVTATFMGGLGLGAWLFGRRLGQRIPPVRLYALLEAFIGIYALLVPTLVGLMGQIDALVLPTDDGGTLSRLLRYLMVGATLLPATLCMGGTLPVLARLVERGGLRPGRFVGALYGLNTTGAVLGAASAGFLLLPMLGFWHTVIACAGANLALAGVAFMVSPSFAGKSQQPKQTRPSVLPGTARPGLALLAYAVSGLVAFMLQVSWTRILTLVFASSLYAFSLILAIFLCGLGLGALFSAPLLDRVASPRHGLAWTLSGAGIMALLGQWLYPLLPGLYLEGLLAHGSGLALGTASALALLLMLPATVALGMGFPLAVRLASGDSSQGIPRQVGRLYAANTTGSVAGAFATALALVPLLGLSGVVSLAGCLAIFLGVSLGLVTGGDSPRRAWAPATLGLTAVLIWLTLVPGWNRTLMSDSVAFWGYNVASQADAMREAQQKLRQGAGPKLLFYQDGVTATVAVKEYQASRFMTVDGKVDASNLADMRTQIFLGQLPLLLTPEPAQDVLIVGLASGVTLGSVLTHPVREAVTLEIEEAVYEAAGYFDDVNGQPLADRRSTVVVEDARAYVERSRRSFDVIISEPSSAWLSGSARLFTHEAFTALRSRLRPGGILCQWLQGYDLDEDALTGVMRTLRDVFPHVAVFRGDALDLLLLASDQPIRITPRSLARRLATEAVQSDLSRAGATTPCSLLNALVAEPAAVDKAIGDGRLNTDDNAWIELRGPRTATALSGESLVRRLQEESQGAASMLADLAPEGATDAGPLALSCLQEGAQQAAASLARHRLGLGPDPTSSYVLGEALRRLGQRLEAIRHFQAAIAGSAPWPSPHVGLALALHELGRHEEALSTWDHAATLNASQDPVVLSGRGQTRLRRGDVEGGIADLQAAQQVGSLSLAANLDLAIALARTGEQQAATAQLEALIEAVPFTGSMTGINTATRAWMAATRQALASLPAANPAAGGRSSQLLQEALTLRNAATAGILEETAERHRQDGMTAAEAYLGDLTRNDPALPGALMTALTSGSRPVALAPELLAVVQELARQGSQPR